MKNIFGINQEKQVIDGNFFIDRTISSEMKDEVEKADDNLEVANNSFTKYGSLFKMIYYIGSIYLIVILIIISKEFKNDVSFDIILNNYKIYIIIAVIVVLIMLFSYKFLKNKVKKLSESEEYTNILDNTMEIYNKSLKELMIPDEHLSIDVLCYLYNEKDNKLKKYNYICLATNVFIEDESLCLADLECVLKISLNDIKEVRRLKKKYTFVNWVKNDKPKHNKYKGYKVVVQNNMLYTVSCYQIVINSAFGDYEILIPEYEIDSIKKLLDVNINEE